MDELATTNELERTFPPKTIHDQFPHHQSLAPRRLHTGLAKGEQITGAGILAEDSFLILGTLGGQVKRVKGKDVQSAAEASWDTIIGLAGKGDGVIFAGTGDDKATALFFTSSRAIRFASADIKPQATPSARGVAGIKLLKGDQMLGGAVIPKTRAKLGVVVVSRTGYVKRVPVEEFPVKGRGGQGVLLLNQTRATGPVVAAGAGRMAGSVDLIAADGKRQRLGDVPATNRANRGRKLAKLKDIVEARVV